MKHTILFGIFAALASTCAAQDVAPIDTISDFNYVWQPHDEYDLFFNDTKKGKFYKADLTKIEPLLLYRILTVNNVPTAPVVAIQ